jgi:hypothetical protein
VGGGFRGADWNDWNEEGGNTVDLAFNPFNALDRHKSDPTSHSQSLWNDNGNTEEEPFVGQACNTFREVDGDDVHESNGRDDADKMPPALAAPAALAKRQTETWRSVNLSRSPPPPATSSGRSRAPILAPR